jgi:hypothetical protein
VVAVGHDEDNEPLTSCIVVPVQGEAAKVETLDKKPKETRTISTFRQAYNETAIKSGIQHRPLGDGPEVTAVDINDLRAAFYRRYVVSEDGDKKKQQAARQKAFVRTIEALPSDFSTEVVGEKQLVWRIT